MNPLSLHIANGNAFFFGNGILILVSLLSIFLKRTIWRIVLRLTIIVGMLSILLSSTPLAMWFYIIWTIPALGLLGSLYSGKDILSRYLHIVRFFIICCCLIAAFLEFPYHLKPDISFDHARPLVILGDSISAGIEGDGVTATWPAILREQSGLYVIDISSPGLTLQSAIRQLKKLNGEDLEHSVILLEIGGNDMLGGTGDIQQFQKDLNKLLDAVSQISNTVMMFELPLPPFHHFYGKTQREFAERYHVALLPKRCFTQVFGQPDAMFDELHLSQNGHRDMAEMLWALIK